jgi:hypothetical protein
VGPPPRGPAALLAPARFALHRPRIGAAGAVAMIAPDMSLHALLARRGAIRLAPVGAPRPAVHQLGDVPSVPAGVPPRARSGQR